jgi:hypothetical protein
MRRFARCSLSQRSPGRTASRRWKWLSASRTPLKLFVSMLILLVGGNASFAAVGKCVAIHDACRASCSRADDETAAGCYQECRENYQRCLGSANRSVNELAPSHPQPLPELPRPGRVKPIPPLKGTNLPSKPLRPVSTKPPPSTVSNSPGGSSPAGGTIFVDHPHHGR